MGLNWAFFTPSDNHVESMMRTVLFVEHAVYLFAIGLMLLVLLAFRRQSLDDFVYFLSVSYREDLEELKWRYNIASHPATLVMIPGILQFVVSSIPVSSCCPSKCRHRGL